MTEPKKEPKEYWVLKFNLDLVAKPDPIRVYLNDEVRDLTEANNVLRKFRLVK